MRKTGGEKEEDRCSRWKDAGELQGSCRGAVGEGSVGTHWRGACRGRRELACSVCTVDSNVGGDLDVWTWA